MEGKPLKLADGADYIIPALTLGLLEKYENELVDLTLAGVTTIYNSMVKAIPMVHEG
jgi:hypothetical protein